MHLHGAWAETPAAPGDPLHILPPLAAAAAGEPPDTFWRAGDDGALHATLTQEAGSPLLVLHPDALLSGTTITSAIRCPRQALLQARARHRVSARGECTACVRLHPSVYRVLQKR